MSPAEYRIVFCIPLSHKKFSNALAISPLLIANLTTAYPLYAIVLFC
jgi:hypothetical protein